MDRIDGRIGCAPANGCQGLWSDFKTCHYSCEMETADCASGWSLEAVIRRLPEDRVFGVLGLLPQAATNVHQLPGRLANGRGQRLYLQDDVLNAGRTPNAANRLHR